MAEALVHEALAGISRDGTVDLTKARALKSAPDAVALLFDALQRQGPQLRVLRLGRCGLAEELRGLGPALSAAPNLLELELEGCNLGPELAAGLVDGLRHCGHLRSLGLENTKLGPEGGRAVVAGLRHWPELEQLVLSRNRVGLATLEDLADAADAVGRLQKLYLGSSALPPEAARVLARVLAGLPELRKLTLSGNGLGDDGALAFATVLERLPLLEKVDVQGLGLTERGVAAVAAALGSCPALQFLNLSYNAMGDAGLLRVAQGFPKWPMLQYLNAQAADITDAGLVAFSGELRNCPKLQTLRLMRNQLKNEGLRALGESLHLCPSLTICDLYDNPVTDEGERAFSVGLAFSGPPPVLGVLGGVNVKKYLEAMRLPVEFRSRTTTDILAFLNERQGGGAPIKMSIAKVLVTGPGGCGKTCAIQTMVNSQFPEEVPAMTNGVDVARMAVNEGTDGAMELLFYDFGGQAVYAATNALFFRTRAVFLVLWNPRVDGTSRAEYAHDVLQANPAAPLVFVTTQADLGHAALRAAELGELRKTYGSNMRGYHHVSAKTGTGMTALFDTIKGVARGLDYMDQDVPRPYSILREQIETRGLDNFAITRDEWYRVAAGVGLKDEESAEAALSLFHAWGVVLELPGEEDAERSIALRPQKLAHVLAQVITASEDKVKNARNGIFRHREMEQVWWEYPAALHRSLLRLLHDTGLGIPLVAEAGEDFAATLIPAMLTAGEEAARDAHAALLAQVRAVAPPLPEQADVLVTLSSLPRHLGSQLQVQMRSMVVLGGWWRSGCIVAMKRPGADGGSVLTAVGRVAFSSEDRQLRLSAVGSSLLRTRVLQTLKEILSKCFSGILVVDLEVHCRHPDKTVRRFNKHDIDEAGASKSALHCSKCGARHDVGDLAFWLEGMARQRLSDASDGPIDVSIGNCSSDTASPAQVASYEALGGRLRAGSAAKLAKDPAIAYLVDRLNQGEQDPEALKYTALLCLQQLLKLIHEMRQLTHKAMAVWLVFGRRSARGTSGELTRTAYPLQPRWDGEWVVDGEHGVELRELLTVTDSTTSVAINHIMARLVEVLEIDPPQPQEVFEGMVWSSDEDSAFLMRKHVKKLYRCVTNPEIGPLWVHKDDQMSFVEQRLLSASDDVVQKLRSDIEASREVVLEAMSSLGQTLQASIGHVLDELQASAEEAVPRMYIVVPANVQKHLVKIFATRARLQGSQTSESPGPSTPSTDEENANVTKLKSQLKMLQRHMEKAVRGLADNVRSIVQEKQYLYFVSPVRHMPTSQITIAPTNGGRGLEMKSLTACGRWGIRLVQGLRVAGMAAGVAMSMGAASPLLALGFGMMGNALGVDVRDIIDSEVLDMDMVANMEEEGSIADDAASKFADDYTRAFATLQECLDPDPRRTTGATNLNAARDPDTASFRPYLPAEWHVSVRAGDAYSAFVDDLVAAGVAEAITLQRTMDGGFRVDSGLVWESFTIPVKDMGPTRIAFHCTPAEAEMLRHRFEAATQAGDAYHLEDVLHPAYLVWAKKRAGIDGNAPPPPLAFQPFGSLSGSQGDATGVGGEERASPISSAGAVYAGDTRNSALTTRPGKAALAASQPFAIAGPAPPPMRHDPVAAAPREVKTVRWAPEFKEELSTVLEQDEESQQSLPCGPQGPGGGAPAPAPAPSRGSVAFRRVSLVAREEAITAWLKGLRMTSDYLQAAATLADEGYDSPAMVLRSRERDPDFLHTVFNEWRLFPKRADRDRFMDALEAMALRKGQEEERRKRGWLGGLRR